MDYTEMQVRVVRLSNELAEERAKGKRVARKLEPYRVDFEGALEEGNFAHPSSMEEAQMLIDNLCDLVGDVFKVLKKEGMQ